MIHQSDIDGGRVMFADDYTPEVQYLIFEAKRKPVRHPLAVRIEIATYLVMLAVAAAFVLLM